MESFTSLLSGAGEECVYSKVNDVTKSFLCKHMDREKCKSNSDCSGNSGTCNSKTDAYKCSVDKDCIFDKCSLGYCQNKGELQGRRVPWQTKEEWQIVINRIRAKSIQKQNPRSWGYA